jgi:protein FAM32A
MSEKNNFTIISGKLKFKSKNSSLLKKRKNENDMSSEVNGELKKQHIESNDFDKKNSADSESNSVHMTEAQKRFLKRKLELETKALKSVAQESFRDRVEKFNLKLSKMTEHNDIPRVSAAGNG